VIQEELFRNYLGRELTSEENLSFRGMPTRDILEYINPDRTEELMDECMRLAKVFLHEAVLFPGIADVLEKLKEAGFPMGVVTSQSSPEVIMMKSHLKLDQWIELWISADDVVNPKPDPEPILSAIEMMGQVVAETIMIGDTLNDLEAGRRADVLTGAALWGSTSPNELLAYLPDYTFHTPEDILDITLKI
jgi:pyrophosphatase PpaX